MIASLRAFIFHRSVFGILCVALLLNGLAWALAHMRSDVPLVVRYTTLGGIEEVGDARVFLYLPIIVLFLFFINLSLAFFYFFRDRTLAFVFLSGGALAQIIFLLSILAMRAVNGY